MTWREWTAGAYMRVALAAVVLGVGALAWTLDVALRPDEVRAAPAAVSITA